MSAPTKKKAIGMISEEKRPTFDCSSRAGALAIAETIRAYWAARGCDVRVWTVQTEFTPIMRSVRHDVRSDLVNGMPAPPAAQTRRAA